MKAGVVGHDACLVAEGQYECAVSVLGDMTLWLLWFRFERWDANVWRRLRCEKRHVYSRIVVFIIQFQVRGSICARDRTGY